MKRKAFFSIYILIFTIFGGVLHGPLMALADHSSSYSGMEMQMETMHHEQNESDQKIQNIQDFGNSLMPCCEDNVLYPEDRGVFQTRQNEVLNLDGAILDDDVFVSSEKKSADVDLSYKYFSPPEEIILASVIKLE